MKNAECHPDKKHVAKGLCRSCYNASWRGANPEKMKDYYAANKDRWAGYEEAREARNPEYKREQRRKAIEANPDLYKQQHQRRAEADPTYARRSKISRHGMTLEQYGELLAQQNGGCAVCGTTPEENGKALAIDHNHKCCPGQHSCGSCVRGLLCHHCNIAAGHLRDDVNRVMGLAAYLLQTTNLLKEEGIANG